MLWSRIALSPFPINLQTVITHDEGVPYVLPMMLISVAVPKIPVAVELTMVQLMIVIFWWGIALFLGSMLTPIPKPS
jgi:hypothetical protein